MCEVAVHLTICGCFNVVLFCWCVTSWVIEPKTESYVSVSFNVKEETSAENRK